VRAAEVASVLIAVGERSKMIAEAALQNDMPANSIQWFSDASQAAEALGQLLHEGDVALVKGSHGLHMERIVNALEVES